jgi:hypothetical protein
MINHQVAPLPAPQSLNPNQNHQHLLNNNDHHQPQSLSCDLSQDAGSGGDKMIIGSGNAQNHSLLLQRSHSMEFMIDQTCGSDAAGNI